MLGPVPVRIVHLKLTGCSNEITLIKRLYVLAFNALIGSAVVLQQISFLIPAILLVCRRRNEAVLPKNRAFALPDAVGWAVNLFAIAFMAVTTIVFMLPSQLPVTASNMSKFFDHPKLRCKRIVDWQVNRLYSCDLGYSSAVQRRELAFAWQNSLSRSTHSYGINWRVNIVVGCGGTSLPTLLLFSRRLLFKSIINHIWNERAMKSIVGPKKLEIIIQIATEKY